jgi:phage tail sheath protein FI
MAELTFKSAGVSTREIDLSGPTPVGPQGTPAGVIGTSLAGPAFVPITFGTFSEFVSIFGAADGEKFGPIAVSEWLKNARSCTYIRVLGIGDGKQRDSSSGVVTNAGFRVGDALVQENGYVGDNLYANEELTKSTKGRTYFLGCFMSESAGSTIFSDAGIQQPSSATKAVYAFQAATAMTGAMIIEDAGGVRRTYHFGSGTQGAAVAESVEPTAAGFNYPAGVAVNTVSQTAATIASRFISALTDADGHGGTITGGASAALAHMTQSVSGFQGNSGIVWSPGTDGAGTYGLHASAARHNSGSGVFASGSSAGGAIPILRGVLMAPSGVILHLSGNSSLSTTSPVFTETASDEVSHEPHMGRRGGTTGSMDLASQEFVMLMNGYVGNASRPSAITASFDMTSPNYFPNIFNTDPLKLEEKGHYLYGHYDIYPTLAKATGSFAVAGFSDGAHGLKEDIAFLLTGSKGRFDGAESSALGNVPAYEDWQDRFSAAKTPFIISQEFDRPYDLFRVQALNDGEGEAKNIKVSIENIAKGTSDVDKFGKFDLVVRRFDDSDDEKKVLESFRGLSLDPGSDRYVARAIGDQNVFFNFDSDAESQKIVVDGTHPVRSRYIRVKLSNDMLKKEVPDEALPLGFRGPNHLVTSGTMLSTGSFGQRDSGLTLGESLMTGSFVTGGYYAAPDILGRVQEPPMPYRQTVAVGTGLNKRVDSRYYWGMQTTRKVSPSQPNKAGLIDESWNTYVKHFPTHRKDTTPFSVGDNAGAAMVNGSILDSDRFNYNMFSLEKVQVVTASDGYADSENWVSASYVRKGSIAANDANKTRGFEVSDLERVSNRKYAKFTVPLQGGFDGTNMFDANKKKLNNNAVKREMDDDGKQGGTGGPTVSAYRKAVDVMGSKSDVEIQLLVLPGIRNAAVTDYAISAVEGRFDAMYIMDIEERDQFNTIITSSVQSPHVLNTVTDFKNRALDTSFAAAYFPDLTIVDPSTNGLVQVPPSVAVLGAYSLNDRIGHPWYAPAGFTRGALGAVESSAVKLNRTNLDDLYDSDINPITAFPGTGITVWGQKTLMQKSSALDRVNVRRLLIDVRRSVRNIANSLLFEPNREETLEKFSSLVNPVLQRVQELSGVDRYKVIIDTTTTTQADVENNTIRGKIFLQPTRAVEFVALDFVVTNAGSELL